MEVKWAVPGSNGRPPACKAVATLTTRGHAGRRIPRYHTGFRASWDPIPLTAAERVWGRLGHYWATRAMARLTLGIMRGGRCAHPRMTKTPVSLPASPLAVDARRRLLPLPVGVEWCGLCVAQQPAGEVTVWVVIPSVVSTA